MTTRIFMLSFAPKHGSYINSTYQTYFVFLDCLSRTAKLRNAAIRCLMRICEWINNKFTLNEGTARKAIVVDMEASRYGTIMPARYKSYFVIYNHKDKYRDVRNMLVKPFHTVAEIIGQW